MAQMNEDRAWHYEDQKLLREEEWVKLGTMEKEMQEAEDEAEDRKMREGAEKALKGWHAAASGASKDPVASSSEVFSTPRRTNRSSPVRSPASLGAHTQPKSQEAPEGAKQEISVPRRFYILNAEGEVVI